MNAQNAKRTLNLKGVFVSKKKNQLSKTQALQQ